MPRRITVGILSLGEMGTGFAKLLVGHNYRVVTNLEGRSEDTHIRARNASIEILPSDVALIAECDYIISIVPPGQAVSIANRISDAYNSYSGDKSTPLYFLDLNAISPRTARSIAEIFSVKSPTIKFLDGGIIGRAPYLRSTPPAGPSSATTTKDTTDYPWAQPSVPISGSISSSPTTYAAFARTMNLKHISDKIGAASGLKCCFATTTKGFLALYIQAFTTASNLGILPHLLEEMERIRPGVTTDRKAAGGLTVMPPKAYRWVQEMEQISSTHEEDGGFESAGKGLFSEVAKVFHSVAYETVLGEEKAEKRKRGLTIEDVAAVISQGNTAKRNKTT